MSIYAHPALWPQHNERAAQHLEATIEIRSRLAPHSGALPYAKVQGRTESGIARWECMVCYIADGSEYALETFLYRTKAEAVAKGVELVLQGYAKEVRQ